MRIIWWLMAAIHGQQCCATLPFQRGKGWSYCVRHKHHLGQHETNDGESFP